MNSISDEFNIDAYFNEEEQNIVIETREEIDTIEQVIDDDKVYEMDIYNSLIQKLPIEKQNNKKYQEKYLTYARQIVELKNEAKEANKRGIETYEDMEKILDFRYNLNWVIPIVLDKQKIYKKIDINQETQDEVYEKYMDQASSKGIIFEDFYKEVDEELKLENDLNKDVINFKNYVKKIFDLRRPFLIKTDLDKKDVGYHFFLKEYTNLLRYFNVDTKYWKEYIGSGPLDTQYDIVDEDDNFIKTAKTTLVNGDFVNLVGFYVIGPEKYNIINTLKGGEYFDRLRVVGKIERIEKNENAIIEVKNHGLKDGDSILIRGSNSEPNIDGTYSQQVKVINQDKFTIPVNTSEGIEGNEGELITKSSLDFNQINLTGKDIDDEKKEYNYGDTTLYLFPEEEISKERYEQIVKKVIPSMDKLLASLKGEIDLCKNIDDFNKVIERYNFTFNDLCVLEYDKIVKILEERYNEKEKENKLFNRNKFQKEIIDLREKLKNEKILEELESNLIYGDEMIMNKNIQKYYGVYPYFKKDVDTIVTRMNWVNNSPDNGKLFYLIVEEKRFSDINKTGNIQNKELKDEIKKLEDEYNKLETDIKKESSENKECNSRTSSFKPVKVYKSFNSLFEDNYYGLDQFIIGDFALIENSSNPHEDGSIFVWDGNHWIIDDVIQNIDDLCILGEKNFKNFNIEKLNCLYRETCKSKKKVRLEKRINKLLEDIKMYQSISESKKDNLLNEIKENIRIAEINLQIYTREKKVKKQETIETFDNEVDDLMKKILMIKDNESREYLQFLLIKKDGLLIDRNIYSITSGKYICCGHFLYLMRINDANDPYFAKKTIDEMITIYGGDDEDGIVYCTNDGKPLDIIEYDENEGLSKLTGEIKTQREGWKTEEELVKESIEEARKEEKEVLTLECNDPILRAELIKQGFKPEQIAKAKDICVKLNTFSDHTGIALSKRTFLNIIIDVLQKMSSLPDFDKFKLQEIKRIKEQGLNVTKIKPSMILENYNNRIIRKKIGLIAARLLLVYQSLIPPKSPVSKFGGASFESFDNPKGVQYIASLVETLKIMPITKTIKTGNKKIMYLPIDKVIDDVYENYKIFIDIPSIKKGLQERRQYDMKETKIEEISVGLTRISIEKQDKLPEGFEKKLISKKDVGERDLLRRKLNHRMIYLNQLLINKIDEAVNQSKVTAFNPKALELDCCEQQISSDTDFYTYIQEKVPDVNLNEMFKELKELNNMDNFFVSSGRLLKRRFPRGEVEQYNTFNIEPNKKDLIKNLFLTYISSGPFKGEKHLFGENNICLISGENKNDILKKDYGEEEYVSLIKYIFSKNKKSLEKEVAVPKLDKELIKELKEDSQSSLEKEIDKFVTKILQLVNKDSDKKYKKEFKELLEKLGYLQDILTEEKIKMESSKKTTSRQIVEYENNRYRMRINNLKNYINNYFRKYIAMVANNHNPTDFVTKITGMDDETSREVQKSIVEDDRFIIDYINETNSLIFKKLQFNFSSNEIDKLVAETNLWDNQYKAIKVVRDFDLCHLSEALLYILIKNLDKFISYQFDIKGSGKFDANRIVALFILDIFDKIKMNVNLLNIPPSKKLNIMSSWSIQKKETEADKDEKSKDQTQKLISSYQFMVGRSAEEDDYEKMYMDIDNVEKQEKMKEDFVKKYKGKFDKAPTEAEILDFLQDQEYEENLDREENYEELSFAKLKEGNDVLDTGDGYGEMEQGIEDDDDTGYQGFEE